MIGNKNLKSFVILISFSVNYYLIIHVVEIEYVGWNYT